MSADNWTICSMCVKRAEKMKDAFREKYYGKLDSYVFTKLFKELEMAVEHVKSYSESEFEPNKEILDLAVEREICIKIDEEEYDQHAIFQVGKVSCSLREDYEQGVNDDGFVFIRYSCSCDCGFEKKYSYDEKPKEEQ